MNTREKTKRRGGGEGGRGGDCENNLQHFPLFSPPPTPFESHFFYFLSHPYAQSAIHPLYHQRRRQQQQQQLEQLKQHHERRKTAAATDPAATASTDEAVTHRQLSAPNPPTNLRAIPDMNFQTAKLPQIKLSWEAPSGGSPPTAYKVYVDGKLLETTVLLESFILPLTIGQRYLFGVAAVNLDGESSRVETSETAQIAPTAPRNPQAVPGDRTIDMYWDPPANNGGTPITGYFVFISPFQGGSDCVPIGPTSCRLSNLTNGEVYELAVMATKPQPTNIMGDVSRVRRSSGRDARTLVIDHSLSFSKCFPALCRSLSSVLFNASCSPFLHFTHSYFYSLVVSPSLPQQVTGMPRALPSGPRNFTLLSGGSYTATVGWDTPLDLGPLPIVGYQISLWTFLDINEPNYPLVSIVSANKRNFQVEGLVPGLVYKFGIQGFTRAGIGAMTLEPKYIDDGVYSPLGLPAAPSEVVVAGLGAATVKLSWSEPDPDGGAGIKNYRITATPLTDRVKGVWNWKPVSIVCTADGPDPECADEYIFGMKKRANLVDGVRYVFTVAAQNKYGWGPESNPAVTAMTEANEA